MDNDFSLVELIGKLKGQFSLIAFGAFTGSLLSAYLAPEVQVKQRIVRFLVMFFIGLSCGGVLGFLIDKFTDSEEWGWTAGGAIAAYGSVEIMDYLKKKVIK